MNKNRILILGKGFFGARLQEELDCPVSERKIFSFKDAEEEIDKFKPEIIINTIGHIGENVDECEKDIDKTLTANTFVPLILCELSLRKKIKLIHFSSGCIYHFAYPNQKPISEDSPPDFFELFYSRTKIYAEEPLRILAEKYPILILRPRVPLDNRPHPRNILTKLINYRRVIDIPNSITYLPDFIKALKYLIDINARGVFNVVNKGALRYPELLEVYKKYVPDFRYEIINLKELRRVRTNVILSTKKLEETGFKVREIHTLLEECVKKYLEVRPPKQ
ncbi:MAG: NAD-dependent epimerase/dehydratase family protein [Candidatus Omnitrophica bacterium]|nr:NAD-dependent epimerase/dehydratase family protein [Candidatus Omnitrophota bacterium]MCM8798298.1 NAD-dependent epimerase/dehydratase family protein [Candidatus Omnitrophota bacterium]